MKSRADGNMDVVIELESAHPPEPIEVHTATGLTPTIGAVTLENRGAKWVVKLTVAPASGNLQVLAGVRCSGDPGSVALRVEWSAAIAYGDAYPVTVDASR